MPVQPFSPLRVLVAEDNLVNRQVAVRLLQKRGHRVAVACNGREALAALEQQSFDLILMDVQMLKWTGWRLLARFASESAEAEITYRSLRPRRMR